MLLRSRVATFANRVLRSPAGLWIPGRDIVVPRHCNVLAVRRRAGGAPEIVAATRNIVTNAGDEYYAQSAAGETPDNDFVNLFLSSAAWGGGGPAKGSTVDDLASVIAGAESAPEATYPQTDDQDADNTGAGVDIVTWKYAYAAGDFNDSDIEGAAIALASESDWGGVTGNPVLTAFDFTAFEKTASDTLTVYINHTFTGV